jgi:SAM-dependent methyltransferase
MEKTMTENSAREKFKKVDLGCGTSKVAPDFIGVDRFPLPGVDIIADINAKLPFENDSVDLVFASHSLEHCADVLQTMQEVYRICKHGAQVCIASPYYGTHLNLANPYHLQCFNEHTPRFWSNREHETKIPAEEWTFPHAENWALGCSDHTDPGIDFRCVRMEFFYFPEYQSVRISRLRSLRKRALDVCDQILYHLIVVKQPFADEMFDKLVEPIELFDPPVLSSRRENNTGIPKGQPLFSGSWHALRETRDSASSALASSAVVGENDGLSAVQIQLERFLEESERSRIESRQELERARGALSTAQRQIALQAEQAHHNKRITIMK